MDVFCIIKKYLKDNKYDGLLNPHYDCCCFLEDIFPCLAYLSSCEPGYKGACQCGNDCTYDIYLNKAEAKKSLLGKDNHKWFWKIDYCKSRQSAPAQAETWKMADKAYDLFHEARRKEQKKCHII